jgi:hypothetical protein
LLPATRVSHDLSALLITAQEQEQGGCSLLRGYLLYKEIIDQFHQIYCKK